MSKTYLLCSHLIVTVSNDAASEDLILIANHMDMGVGRPAHNHICFQSHNQFSSAVAASTNNNPDQVHSSRLDADLLLPIYLYWVLAWR